MSSSEEEDERLRDAIDTTLFSDNLYNKKLVKPVEKLKSNRYLENEDKHTDIRVSADMQKRVGDKVSKIINNQIEFVEKKCNDKSVEEKEEQVCGIKLFIDSENFLDHEKVEEFIQQPRKKIKKRMIEDDVVDAKDKIKLAAVSPDFITSKEELKYWKSRRKQKKFEYKKNKSGALVLENVIEKFEYK